MPTVKNYAGWTVRRAQEDAEASELQLAITDGDGEHAPTPAEMPRQISHNDESTPPGAELPPGCSVAVWLEPATLMPSRSLRNLQDGEVRP